MSFDKEEKIDPGEYAIIAENICKRFSGSNFHPFAENLLGIKLKAKKEFQALRDISFKIKKGESVGILGDNGSGKSTLLQVIAKTLQPSSGTVQTNGKLAALLELGSGFNPDFTGRENIYLNASILGLSKCRIDEVLEEILDFADIDHFVDRPVKTYSSGMRMRLAFAVQVFVEPEILIIDEAIGVGDQNFRLKCFSKITELLSKEITFVLVSHNQEILYNLTDRILVIHQGKVAIDSETFDSIEYYNKEISEKSNFKPYLHNSAGCNYYFSRSDGVSTEQFSEGEDIVVNYTFDNDFPKGTIFLKFLVRNKQRILIYEKTIEVNFEDKISEKFRFIMKGIIARNIYSLEIFETHKDIDCNCDTKFFNNRIKYFEVISSKNTYEYRGICNMKISAFE